ncbi:hypothetical protein Tco_0317064 [Tanacetum coccineum]
MDERFIAAAYPDVQENMKLTVDEHVIPEEPVNSTGTLTNIISSRNYIPASSNYYTISSNYSTSRKCIPTNTEAESMVSVTIQQDTSVIPLMTSPVISPVPRPDSPNVHWPLPTTTTTTSATTTTTLPLPPQPQQGPSDPIIIKRMGELEELIATLVEENQALEERLDNGEEYGRDHIPTVNLKQSWWKPLTEDIPATPEPAWNIPSSDLTMPTNNWASSLKSTYAPLQENSLLAQTGDMTMFMDWYCKRQGITHLTLQDLEGPAFKIVKVFHPDVIHLQFQMEECHKLLTDQVDDPILRYNVSKPLPLGGKPGHVTIQPDFFFNKDLEYLRYGRKVGRLALSISKMKAAYYPVVGLEQLVPDQFWIEAECKYDITTMDERMPDSWMNKDERIEASLHVRYPETTKDKHSSGIWKPLSGGRILERPTTRLHVRNPSKDLRVHRIILVVLQNILVIRKNNAMKMEILLRANIKQALGRSVLTDPEDQAKNRDGDTSFQWSQFTTQCSHLMFPSKDIMITE